MTSETKTRIFKIRLTETEYADLKRLAENYNGRMSHVVIEALNQFDDEQSRNRFKTLKECLKALKDRETELHHIGTNLNQAVKRINELSLQGNFDKTEARKFTRQVAKIIDIVELDIATIGTYIRVARKR